MIIRFLNKLTFCLLLIILLSLIVGFSIVKADTKMNQAHFQINLDQNGSAQVIGNLTLYQLDPNKLIWQIPKSYQNQKFQITPKQVVTINNQTYSLTIKQTRTHVNLVADINLQKEIATPAEITIEYQISELFTPSQLEPQLYIPLVYKSLPVTINNFTATINSPNYELGDVECLAGPADKIQRFCRSEFDPYQARFLSTKPVSSDFQWIVIPKFKVPNQIPVEVPQSVKKTPSPLVKILAIIMLIATICLVIVLIIIKTKRRAPSQSPDKPTN